jgi:hypothetical protein
MSVTTTREDVSYWADSPWITYGPLSDNEATWQWYIDREYAIRRTVTVTVTTSEVVVEARPAGAVNG